MMPRHILLRQPHMAMLLDHPALTVMTDSQLAALESFLAFCAAERLDDPQIQDLRAFGELRVECLDQLTSLELALQRLGLPQEFLAACHTAAREWQHRQEFGGILHGPQPRDRTVSVSFESLPLDWRKTLRRLRADRLATIDRMESRLGMFVWSATRAGRPIDLGDTAALTALYNDMRGRSAEKKANGGVPRWAYLRGAWEELHRFAGAHGLPQEVCDKLAKTKAVLVRKEEMQEANKISKARTVGTQPELLERAEKMLVGAEAEKRPQMRHALRNRATAIAMGCFVPARPLDVKLHHAFGAGIRYEPDRGAYRFAYTANKTRTSTGKPIDIPLLPYCNKFLDALILQDQDTRYLNALRDKATADLRPLYVNYDGTPVAYAWYSRMWSAVTGTGGHIARALVYDETIHGGEDGLQFGRASNGHAPHSRVVTKYRTERTKRAMIKNGQRRMRETAADDSDDISDLL